MPSFSCGNNLLTKTFFFIETAETINFTWVPDSDIVLLGSASSGCEAVGKTLLFELQKDLKVTLFE